MYVDSAGSKIYVESVGDPAHPTLVFAHGAGGNAAIWYNQLAHFSTSYHCITFDHRCFARSPSDPSLMRVTQLRDDLPAILDMFDVAQAHLVGQSMGGFTVLRTALDAPARVASLTMSCTTGGIINPSPSSAFRKLTQAQGRGTSDIHATMSEATRGNPVLMQLYESINSFNTEFSWDKLRNLVAPDEVIQLDQLAQVSCPTLLVSGAEDPLFPPSLIASYTSSFQQATFVEIERAGHSPYFEQPEVFNRILAEHLLPLTQSKESA